VEKFCEAKQATDDNNFFFLENCTVYEIMSKNMVETERPQMTSQYGAYALRAG
jgi:hypothetical protein